MPPIRRPMRAPAPVAKDGPRINDEIRTREVHLIAADGANLGNVPIAEALAKAQEAGLDLVEISPNAEPPVCKLLDFGKYKYQEQKKQVEFTVPREHWNAIVSALTPAQKDSHPAKWVGMGELRFQLANGNPWVVTLYEGDGDRGAFSAGPNWDQRVYYRGGNTAELQNAMAAAFQTAAQNRD